MSLEDYLAEYAKGILVQWMHIVDLDGEHAPDNPSHLARARWHENNEFALSDGLGRFRLNLTVTRLPDPPPIGPGNDPAQIEEMKQHPCSECSTEDPRPWCDCREDETCKGPCRQRAHNPNVCPNLIYVCETCNSGGHTCPGDGTPIKHGQGDCGQHDEPEWVPTTWRYVLKGDEVRLGESEAEVMASNVGDWHVDASDYWRPKAWEHTEVKVQLRHTGDLWLPWPPDSAVEILMDGTRKAAYVLQQAFEGTREVK